MACFGGQITCLLYGTSITRRSEFVRWSNYGELRCSAVQNNSETSTIVDHKGTKERNVRGTVKGFRGVRRRNSHRRQAHGTQQHSNTVRTTEPNAYSSQEIGMEISSRVHGALETASKLYQEQAHQCSKMRFN